MYTNGENVFVASRLDLIYKDVTLKYKSGKRKGTYHVFNFYLF